VESELTRFADTWSHFLQRTGSYFAGTHVVQRIRSYLTRNPFSSPEALEDENLSTSSASELIIREAADPIAPLRIDERHSNSDGWAGWLILFLRAVAVLLLAKGLYHWAVICGFGTAPGGGFEAKSSPWQMATVFFAIIDLVAAVGLWLGASWGVIIWLASSVTMIVVHALLPQIYGFQPVIIVGEIALIIGYVFIAFEAAREQPV
jgi:hypothetical protein